MLQRRLDKLGHSSDAYLWGLQREPSSGEIDALARELTVGETYFFRNIEQFRALAEVVLPERMGVDRTPRTLRLLSAGCASGEEAYSMAIVARETIADPSWEVLIRAVDLNPAALEKAARARYSSWALRETPPDVQRKWFRPDGREMVLDETVRAAVKFEAANLASDDPELWQPGAYDAIFCRNVLMYFSPEQMRAVIARIAQSLAPGGFLFLGHAETLRGISDALPSAPHPRHLLLRAQGAHRARTCAQPATAGAEAGCRRPRRPRPSSDAWFHAIRKATERVAALVPARPAPTTRRLRRRRCPGIWRRRSICCAGSVSPRRSTMFAPGRRRPSAIPTCCCSRRRCSRTAGRSPPRRRLSAAAADRRAQCRGALRAGALPRAVADRDGAGEHDRVAAYLDPEFAMPRLHLGLLARRAGDRDAARRELAQALVLLKREDASRLLLFGGGFNREALMALCESALRDSGGQP